MADIAGIRRQFIRTAMEAPFLARDEERGLAVRWKENRDETALHQLTAAHMRLVIALAAFMADPEWAKIKIVTAEAHGPLVGDIEDRTLELTNYSPGGRLAN